VVAPAGVPAPRIELADGPDAGSGASAPGGARARVSPLASYLSADDYPAVALRNNEQGRVTVILDVNAAGRVTNCSVAETSGSAALDSATCRIMRSRPRYTPARNPRGVAVADRDRASVRWQLPSG
jgi:protein TonB